MVANGILQPFGARAEEMASEEPAAYLGSVYVPDNRDTPPLAVGAPLPEPSVPLADQPAFAELMRLELQLVDALAEEMIAGLAVERTETAYRVASRQGSPSVYDQVMHDAAVALQERNRARDQVYRLGEEIVHQREQLASKRAADREALTRAMAGGGA